MRLVSLLIYRVSALMRMRIAYGRRICSTWPLPGALRKTFENNIFKPNKPEKIPERLARYRSAVEMQCFCNCTLSSLLLTRSAVPRDLHLWLPHGTSQNAIFSNQKMQIICEINWREVGVAFELQCLRNCTLSSYIVGHSHVQNVEATGPFGSSLRSLRSYSWWEEGLLRRTWNRFQSLVSIFGPTGLKRR